ncbi:hypothetical protein Vretifemale_5105 [Volvox reticuliferus]|nr:hypothetical protein Vretifemale_5105 [Volvox reticuliferus]
MRLLPTGNLPGPGPGGGAVPPQREVSPTARAWSASEASSLGSLQKQPFDGDGTGAPGRGRGPGRGLGRGRGRGRAMHGNGIGTRVKGPVRLAREAGTAAIRPRSQGAVAMTSMANLGQANGLAGSRGCGRSRGRGRGQGRGRGRPPLLKRPLLMGRGGASMAAAEPDESDGVPAGAGAGAAAGLAKPKSGPAEGVSKTDSGRMTSSYTTAESTDVAAIDTDLLRLGAGPSAPGQPARQMTAQAAAAAAREAVLQAEAARPLRDMRSPAQLLAKGHQVVRKTRTLLELVEQMPMITKSKQFNAVTSRGKAHGGNAQPGDLATAAAASAGAAPGVSGNAAVVGPVSREWNQCTTTALGAVGDRKAAAAAGAGPEAEAEAAAGQKGVTGLSLQDGNRQRPATAMAVKAVPKRPEGGQLKRRKMEAERTAAPAVGLLGTVGQRVRVEGRRGKARDSKGGAADDATTSQPLRIVELGQLAAPAGADGSANGLVDGVSATIPGAQPQKPPRKSRELANLLGIHKKRSISRRPAGCSGAVAAAAAEIAAVVEGGEKDGQAAPLKAAPGSGSVGAEPSSDRDRQEAPSESQGLGEEGAQTERANAVLVAAVTAVDAAAVAVPALNKEMDDAATNLNAAVGDTVEQPALEQPALEQPALEQPALQDLQELPQQSYPEAERQPQLPCQEQQQQPQRRRGRPRKVHPEDKKAAADSAKGVTATADVAIPVDEEAGGVVGNACVASGAGGECPKSAMPQLSPRPSTGQGGVDGPTIAGSLEGRSGVATTAMAPLPSLDGDILPREGGPLAGPDGSQDNPGDIVAVAEAASPVGSALREALAVLATSASQMKEAVAAAATATGMACGATAPDAPAEADGSAEPEDYDADPLVGPIKRALTSEWRPIERLSLLRRLMGVVCRAVEGLAGVPQDTTGRADGGGEDAVPLAGFLAHARSGTAHAGGVDVSTAEDSSQPVAQKAARPSAGASVLGKRRRRRKQQQQTLEEVEEENLTTNPPAGQALQPAPAQKAASDGAARPSAWCAGEAPGSNIEDVTAGPSAVSPATGDEHLVMATAAVGLERNGLSDEVVLLPGSTDSISWQLDLLGVDTSLALLSEDVEAAAAMPPSLAQRPPPPAGTAPLPVQPPRRNRTAMAAVLDMGPTGGGFDKDARASGGRVAHGPSGTELIEGRNRLSPDQLQQAEVGSEEQPTQSALTEPSPAAETLVLDEPRLAPLPALAGWHSQERLEQPDVGRKRPSHAYAGNTTAMQVPELSAPHPRWPEQEQAWTGNMAQVQPKRPRLVAPMAEEATGLHQDALARDDATAALESGTVDTAAQAICAPRWGSGGLFVLGTSPPVLQTLTSAAVAAEGLGDGHTASPPLPTTNLQPPPPAAMQQRGRRSSTSTTHCGNGTGLVDSAAPAVRRPSPPPAPGTDASGQAMAPGTRHSGRPPRPRLVSNPGVPSAAEDLTRRVLSAGGAPEPEYGSNVGSYRNQPLEEQAIMQQQQQQQYLQHVQHRQLVQPRQQQHQLQEQLLRAQLQQQQQQREQQQQQTYMLLQQHNLEHSQRAMQQESQEKQQQQQQQQQLLLQQQLREQLQQQLSSEPRGPQGSYGTRRVGSQFYVGAHAAGLTHSSQQLPLPNYPGPSPVDDHDVMMLGEVPGKQESITRFMRPIAQRQYDFTTTAAMAAVQQPQQLPPHQAAIADLDIGGPLGVTAHDLDLGLAQGQDLSLSSQQSPTVREVSLRIRPLQASGPYGMSKVPRTSAGLSEPSGSVGQHGGFDVDAEPYGRGLGHGAPCPGQHSGGGVPPLTLATMSGIESCVSGGPARRSSTQHRSSYENVAQAQVLFDHSQALTSGPDGVVGCGFPGSHVFNSQVQHVANAAAMAVAPPQPPLRYTGSGGLSGPASASQRGMTMSPGPQLVLLRTQHAMSNQLAAQHGQHAVLQPAQQYQRGGMFEPRFLAAAIRELGAGPSGIGSPGTSDELLGRVSSADMLTLGVDPGFVSRGQG